MASFYGRQQTANQGTAQTKTTTAVASSSACLKSCEKVMNQCLVDATTFQEKERCRDRYDICSGKCGTIEEPVVTRQATATPVITATTGAAGAAGGTPQATARPCGVNGECKQGKWCTPATQQQDCCGEDCINGKCECQPSQKECIPNGACAKNTDCGTKGKCVNGKCNCTPSSQCVHGAPCGGNEDCAGKWCKGGKCYCPPPACVEGATCTDAAQCQPGGSCINGKCYCKSGSCKDDATCVRLHTKGWTCYKTAGSPTGICKPPGGGGDGECTPGKKCTGPEKENSQCGGAKCFRPKSWNGDEKVAGTCYCKGGEGDGDGDGDGLGEYQWPSNLTDLYNQMMGKAGDYLNMDLPDYALSPELQSLLDQLLGRAGEYLGRKPGYSQSALEAMFGKNYENIRNLGTLTRQQTESGLQREGMLGTGAGQAALRQIPWQTEKNVSDVVRDVFLGNEDQKRKDLEAFTNMASGLFGQGVGVEQMVEAINAERRREERDYTGIANTLFGSGMTYNQLQEAINAARRGEGQNALALYLQYVVSLMNSWKS